MKTINITEEHALLITDIISKAVVMYAKSPKVDAIYMISYSEEVAYKQEIPFIDLMVVYNDPSYTDDLSNEELDILEECEKITSVTGVQITISDKNYQEYDSRMRFREEILACRDLINGDLLFDRDNKYSAIIEKTSRNSVVSRPYNNKAEIKPALQLIRK